MPVPSPLHPDPRKGGWGSKKHVFNQRRFQLVSRHRWVPAVENRHQKDMICKGHQAPTRRLHCAGSPISSVKFQTVSSRRDPWSFPPGGLKIHVFESMAEVVGIKQAFGAEKLALFSKAQMGSQP